MKYELTKEQLQKAVDNSLSIAQVCRELNIVPVGGNYKTVKAKLLLFNISTSHFTGQGWNVGKKYKFFGKKYTDDQIFKVDSECGSNKSVKNRLLEKGRLTYKCNCCGISDWNNKSITLELNHINGNNTDNSIQNLELLCPNCHSQTDTFRSKNLTSVKNKKNISIYQKFKDVSVTLVKDESTNKLNVVKNLCKICNKQIFKTRAVYCSYECKNLGASSKIPTYPELLNAFKIHKSALQVGKHFNVSDSAVHKWCKRYGIDKLLLKQNHRPVAKLAETHQT